MAIVGRGWTAASEARSKASPCEIVTSRQPELAGKRRRGRRGSPLVVAQDRRDRDGTQAVHRLQHIAPGARRDVEQPHRPCPRRGFARSLAQQSFEMHAALPDAAPADAVEIVAVDQPAQRRHAPRPVLVDVIERDAGIEAGFASRDECPRSAGRALHRRSDVSAVQRAARPRKSVVLGFRVAPLVGIQQATALPAAGEAFA